MSVHLVHLALHSRLRYLMNHQTFLADLLVFVQEVWGRIRIMAKNSCLVCLGLHLLVTQFA